MWVNSATCKFSLQRHIWHDFPFPPTSPLIFHTFCSITCIGLNHGFGALDRSISWGIRWIILEGFNVLSCMMGIAFASAWHIETSREVHAAVVLFHETSTSCCAVYHTWIRRDCTIFDGDHGWALVCSESLIWFREFIFFLQFPHYLSMRGLNSSRLCR